MSLFSFFSRLVTNARRRLKKLVSLPKYRVKTVPLTDIIYESEGNRPDIDHYYCELTYRPENTPSQMVNVIFKKFRCLHDLNEFVKFYGTTFTITKLKRGVVLK